MPALGDETHRDIVRSLKNRVPQILKLGTPSQPRAIVLVTAHWQTHKPTVSSIAKPSLIYDYYGFPDEAYKLKYPAAGDPEVARQVRDALEAEGLEAELDETRGWDHGVFIPMMLVHPRADVPIVQMSVLRSEDPVAHLRVGAALARLRADNVAIVGSGFASWHNLGTMRTLMQGSGPAVARLREQSRQWGRALDGAVAARDREARRRALGAWRQLPHADAMHPPGRGEHFMPLLVCAGAAADGERAGSYVDGFLGMDIWTWYWGAEDGV